MACTEIFSFDISGDKHLEKAIAVALCPDFGDKPIELWGYQDLNDTLYFYDRPYKDDDKITPFPAPILDPKDMIISWLKNQEWSTSGQYGDVVYRRGYRIFNNGIGYHPNIIFAVQSHWTEYHK